MSEGYGLVVRFTLLDEAAAAAFDDLCAETLKGIKAAEPGTLVYVSHRPVGEPLVRVFYELYADRSAFEVHESQPHVQHFLATREQFVAHFEVTFLDALHSKTRVEQ
jgi:quinol monooxygenase YgiN